MCLFTDISHIKNGEQINKYTDTQECVMGCSATKKSEFDPRGGQYFSNNSEIQKN